MVHRSLFAFDEWVAEEISRYGKQGMDWIIDDDQETQWRQGVYHLTRIGNHLTVENKYTNGMAKLSVSPLEDFYADANYSEEKAELRSSRGFKKSLSTLIREQNGGSKATKECDGDGFETPKQWDKMPAAAPISSPMASTSTKLDPSRIFAMSHDVPIVAPRPSAAPFSVKPVPPKPSQAVKLERQLAKDGEEISEEEQPDQNMNTKVAPTKGMEAVQDEETEKPSDEASASGATRPMKKLYGQTELNSKPAAPIKMERDAPSVKASRKAPSATKKASARSKN